MDDDFEWDDATAETNLVRHEVSLLDGAAVFEDASALALHDPDRREEDEQRFRIIGAVEGVVLTVAYAEDGARTRIFSARRASSYERRTYHQG